MPQEKWILNILHLKHTGLNFFLVFPSYQPYCLSFFISSASLSPGVVSCSLCHAPSRVGVGVGWKPLSLISLMWTIQARSPNGYLDSVIQFCACSAGDPQGPVVPTVFCNTVQASCARRACLINYCLPSCSSLYKLFLLARIRKSKQSTLTVLFWGGLSRVNAEAGALLEFEALGFKAGR